MATTISFSTIDTNIYKNFYDILNAVASLSDKIHPEFPDITLDSKSDYPVAVLDSPINPWEKVTMGRNKVMGHIDFSYYCTTAKDRDTVGSLANAAIESAKSSLASVKLQNVTAEVSKDMVPHGNIKVYIVTLTINYRYTFVSTRGY